jgi:hypothetical protein
MAQAPIIAPTPANTSLSWLQTAPNVQQASAGAFYANQFVKIQGSGSGQTMIKVADATSAEPCYGIAQRDALATTSEPYLTPTADYQGAINVASTPVWLNTMTSSRAVGTGDATALVAGSTYHLRSFTTANYTTVQGVDSSSTAAGAGFVKYLGKLYPGDAAADTNCRALFQVVAPLQNS